MNRMMLRSLFIAAALAGITLSVGCTRRHPAGSADPLPVIDAPWQDEFERDDVGTDYYATHGTAYQMSNGSVMAQGAVNHPLWLRRRLPDDAIIELDAWSQSPDGDIKVEIYGDGHSYDPDGGAYLATGYVLVMGGWKNSKSIIARRDEHGKDVAMRKGPSVEMGKRYHWKIVRQGGSITWYVDDVQTPYLTLRDPKPLKGPSNSHFAFNNWETNVGFDNLKIAPL